MNDLALPPLRKTMRKQVWETPRRLFGSILLAFHLFRVDVFSVSSGTDGDGEVQFPAKTGFSFDDSTQLLLQDGINDADELLWDSFGFKLNERSASHYGSPQQNADPTGSIAGVKSSVPVTLRKLGQKSKRMRSRKGNILFSGKLRGIVKINAEKWVPNFAIPWGPAQPNSVSGTGFVVEDRLIITNANIVTYAHYIGVKKRGSRISYKAELIAVCHAADLAVLTVADDDFWVNVSPLSLAEGNDESSIPLAKERVTVLGYPLGEDALSTINGVVSGVDVGIYSHSGTELIRIQIDTAIKRGNSGAPVFSTRGKVVGVAMDAAEAVENVSYAIPVPIVRHVLTRVRNERSRDDKDASTVGKDGKVLIVDIAELGVITQMTRNRMMKKYTGTTQETLRYCEVETFPQLSDVELINGCMVLQAAGEPTCFEDRTVIYLPPRFSHPPLEVDIPLELKNETSASAVGFKKCDLIISLQGHSVAADCTVLFRRDERVDMSYLVSGKQINDEVQAMVLREQKLRQITVRLSPVEYVVPKSSCGRSARYLTFGGALMVPLSVQYVSSMEKSMSRLSMTALMLKWMTRFATPELQEIVLVSQMLPCNLLTGFIVRNEVLESINGVRVRSLRHAYELLLEGAVPSATDQESSSSTKASKFVLKIAHSNYSIVIDRERATRESDTILRMFQIPAAYDGGCNE